MDEHDHAANAVAADAAGTADTTGTASGIELLARNVRPANAYEETLQHLLQAIRLGMLEPGAKLPPERRLATMLRVSRDTIRDVLGTLADAGFVESRRGRYGGSFILDATPVRTRGVATATSHGTDGLDATSGAVTAAAPASPTAASYPPQPDGSTLSAAEVEDVTVMRRILEIGAAREAANRELTAAQRASLMTAYEDCAQANDYDYRRLDSRFHLLVAELAGAPTLVSLAADVRTRMNALLDQIPLLAPNLSHSNEQHLAIVTAILSGREDAAATAMGQHIDGSAALLRGFMTRG